MELGRQQLGLGAVDLWFRFFAVGGRLDAYLHGHTGVSPADRANAA